MRLQKLNLSLNFYFIAHTFNVTKPYYNISSAQITNGLIVSSPKKNTSKTQKKLDLKQVRHFIEQI